MFKSQPSAAGSTGAAVGSTTVDDVVTSNGAVVGNNCGIGGDGAVDRNGAVVGNNAATCSTAADCNRREARPPSQSLAPFSTLLQQSCIPVLVMSGCNWATASIEKEKKMI